ncbi:uncharacterized protein LOC143036674 [Oratosquilla oratoria]|uniref:uncharacterized protein LOC143036674 n=1 Tax=Oratosquilla oratoria TaxID=337810 RepID=UPI003F775413
MFSTSLTFNATSSNSIVTIFLKTGSLVNIMSIQRFRKFRTTRKRVIILEPLDVNFCNVGGVPFPMVTDMESFDIAQFIKSPGLALLQNCEVLKDDWIALARFYKVQITGKSNKADIKKAVIQDLISKKILEDSAKALCDMELQGETERDEDKAEITKMELEFAMMEKQGVQGLLEPTFDINRVVRLVPTFLEGDPEEFFEQFESLATTLSLPKPYWCVLVQTALVGKARSSYLSLSSEDQSQYSVVKDTVLKAYLCTPEFYRQKFRNCFRGNHQSYLEYGNSVNRLFNRWLSASGIETYEELKELIALEQYVKGIPPDVRTYLLEKEVSRIDRAATLAENYTLTHKSSKPPSPPGISQPQEGKVHKGKGTWTLGKSNTDVSKIGCFYCKKFGHVRARCPELTREKRVANVTLLSADVKEKGDPDVGRERSLFNPFVFPGTVSVEEDGPGVSVTVLRDTAASLSMVLQSAVPDVEQALTGEHVLIKGVGGTMTVPLCKLFLRTELLSRPVLVGVGETLPVEGVSFLLGNDIAGKLIVPDPVVSMTPLEWDPAEGLESECGDIFPACAVTRSQARMKTSEETADMDISSLFNVDSSTGPAVKPDELADRDVDSPSPGVLPCSLSSDKVNEAQSNVSERVDISVLPMTRSNLISAQKADRTLIPLFARAIQDKDISNEATCYYTRNDVLMRKYRPPDVPANESWCEFHQVIVPDVYREKVISFSHDYIGGHLGVQKTLDKIIKYFYWPGIHRQVAQYCKTCETCQLVGKPNIVIPPAPLQPIPVVPEPFTHVIIDVVGPLPKTKKGHLYMLTLMCTTTRYPEAIPLRSITARTVLPALTKFFTLFGIPKIVQSDRGTNFVSNIFRQVMSLLGIKQYIASAYHAQSQGALERFHGTFKTMLAKYGHETGNEWDVGLPFLLYAIRCAKQSSLGFSPSELLFGRDIRGPMKLLHESWIDLEHADNLSEYVSKLKENLDVVHRFAQCNLKLSQEKMKENYDKDAVERNFEVGDEVLLFLPVRKCPLQARYKGPFRVIGKRGDLNYVISTPDHRKTKRLVHVNLIKKYHRRDSGSAAKTEEKVDGTVNSLEVVEMQSEDDLDKIPVGNKLKNSDVLANLNSKLYHLSDSQQSDVSELLQEFVEIFGDVPRPTTEAVHHIELVEGAAPVREKPYRMSPHKAAILQKEVTFLLDNHLAEPSKSDWAAPCILVPKGNGEYRMCTDYRKLNALTKADNFPLPRIDDLIDSIGKAKIITKLDLMSGYYQMPLSEEAKRVSSFITPSGLYQYKVTFLGHEVGYGTVAPMHAKVEAIEALAAPANRKAVQRFLGVAGYYRRFCPNFSKLAKPLTDLVSPKVKFRWTLECQEAFDKIKSILTSKPVLHGPDFSKNFTINVDASDAAAGAVLMQEHDGILFPLKNALFRL